VTVDAHHHLWTDPAQLTWLDEPGHEPLRRAFSFSELQELMAPHGVRGSVVVEAGGERPAELGELLHIASNEDGLLGVVGWLDADDASSDGARSVAAAWAHEHAEEWLKGLRIQAQSRPEAYLDHPRIAAAAARLGALERVLEVVVVPRHLPSVGRLAAAHPGTIVVIDHCAKPAIVSSDPADFEHWRDALREVARRPNTVCKVSGLVTQAPWSTWESSDVRPYVDTVVEIFGPQRLMFGSDWPVCQLAATYDEVVETARTCLAALSESEQRWVFEETATRTYTLERP
jgi:L-fuconolactonase